MHSRIKELTGRQRKRSDTAIKKRDGEIAVGIDEVRQRWQDYTEEMFDGNRQPFEMDVADWGTPIQSSEVEFVETKQLSVGRSFFFFVGQCYPLVTIQRNN